MYFLGMSCRKSYKAPSRNAYGAELTVEAPQKQAMLNAK